MSDGGARYGETAVEGGIHDHDEGCKICGRQETGKRFGFRGRRKTRKYIIPAERVL